MRVLLTLAQFTLGGSETYSATVAEQLERLGHRATIYAPKASAGGRELAERKSIRLVVGDEPPVDDVDAVLAQDSASAYRLARSLPGHPQAFVIHGLAPHEQPPVALDPVPPVVVLNNRIAARAAAGAANPEIVRLRQPINIQRFRPRDGARNRARRVLLLSNYLDGNRVDLIEGVCEELGLELDRVGTHARQSANPQGAIGGADIVVGYGRSALDGMAMGRAAYVWGLQGGDGFVTPENYAAIEGDGFSGAGTDAIIDRKRLLADFAGYDPAYGELGWDLVRQHHSAAKHTEALVELLGRAPVPAAEDRLHETVAQLVRLTTRAEIRVDGLESENRRLHEKVGETATMAAQLDLDRREAHERLQGVVGSWSWRLTAPLRRVLALVRRS